MHILTLLFLWNIIISLKYLIRGLSSHSFDSAPLPQASKLVGDINWRLGYGNGMPILNMDI